MLVFAAAANVDFARTHSDPVRRAFHLGRADLAVATAINCPTCRTYAQRLLELTKQITELKGNMALSNDVRDAFTSSIDTEWETPQDFFEHLNREFHFTLDVCADESNFKMRPYISPKQDAFKMEWTGTTFCNPPYGREIGKWVAENYAQAQTHFVTSVMLLPARTDTGWFHKYVMRASEVRLISGRISFLGPTCAAPGLKCEKFATHPDHRERSRYLYHEFTPGPDKAMAPALFPSMVVVFKPGEHYALFSTLAWKSGWCLECGEPILSGASIHPSCRREQIAT